MMQIILPLLLFYNIFLDECSKRRSDEFIVNPEDTKSQIETARELLNLVKKYIDAN